MLDDKNGHGLIISYQWRLPRSAIIESTYFTSIKLNKPIAQSISSDFGISCCLVYNTTINRNIWMDWDWHMGAIVNCNYYVGAYHFVTIVMYKIIFSAE